MSRQACINRLYKELFNTVLSIAILVIASIMILISLFSKMFGGNEMYEVGSLLVSAVNETHKVNAGEKFLLKDLFKGYEWNRISRSDRLLLGTLFLNHVNTSKIGILAVEKTTSGQQQYVKE